MSTEKLKDMYVCRSKFEQFRSLSSESAAARKHKLDEFQCLINRLADMRMYMGNQSTKECYPIYEAIWAGAIRQVTKLDKRAGKYQRERFLDNDRSLRAIVIIHWPTARWRS